LPPVTPVPTRGSRTLPFLKYQTVSDNMGKTHQTQPKQKKQAVIAFDNDEDDEDDEEENDIDEENDDEAKEPTRQPRRLSDRALMSLVSPYTPRVASLRSVQTFDDEDELCDLREEIARQAALSSPVKGQQRPLSDEVMEKSPMPSDVEDDNDDDLPGPRVAPVDLFNLQQSQDPHGIYGGLEDPRIWDVPSDGNLSRMRISGGQDDDGGSNTDDSSNLDDDIVQARSAAPKPFGHSIGVRSEDAESTEDENFKKKKKKQTKQKSKAKSQRKGKGKAKAKSKDVQDGSDKRKSKQKDSDPNDSSSSSTSPSPNVIELSDSSDEKSTRISTKHLPGWISSTKWKIFIATYEKWVGQQPKPFSIETYDSIKAMQDIYDLMYGAAYPREIDTDDPIFIV
ncbi:hypothetical protein CERSUDRAFT_78772, partial [Gelatoporia subvermispora B]